MKKLSLKNLNLEAKELLQKDQLKAVFGGYHGGYLNCNSDCSFVGFSCPKEGGKQGLCKTIICSSYPSRTYKKCI